MLLRHALRIAFLLLTGITLVFCLRQCGLGRINEAFSDLDGGLRRNLPHLDERSRTCSALARSYLLADYEAGVRVQLSPFTRAEEAYKSFSAYVDSLRLCVLTEAGVTPEELWQATRRHAQAAQRVLLAGEPNALEQLASRARALRAAFVAVDSGGTTLAHRLPFYFDDQADSAFRLPGYDGDFANLPLSGIVAMLSNLRVQAAASMLVTADFFLSTAYGGAAGCNLCSYRPVVSPLSWQVDAGEAFDATIYLCGCPFEIEVLGLLVNGKSIPIHEYAGHYTARAGSLGRKTLDVEFRLCRIRYAGERFFRDTFSVRHTQYYEVGMFAPRLEFPGRTAFLYAGVKNPITLRAWNGFAGNDFRREAVNGTLEDTPGGRGGDYTLQPHGRQPVTLWLRDVPFRYPVRPLPDPIASLPGQTPGHTIDPGILAVQTQLSLRLRDDLDVLDAECRVLSFALTRFRAREDAMEVTNPGPAFKDDVRQVLQTTRAGDRLLFDDIEVACPGDAGKRTIAPLCVRVKQR